MTIAPQAKTEWKDAHVHPPGFRARRGLNWFTVGLLYSMYYMCRYNFRFAGPGMRDEFGWDQIQCSAITASSPGWRGMRVRPSGSAARTSSRLIASRISAVIMTCFSA